ncbi:hypothetical protein BG55_01845 [Erwinia mallotivora]|uniref:Uncharacterized protein n=1 Tax=Erwinia mallotivora TaxID=69222 RepID=A0A014NTN2_9GAMM|nr:hypothetical protein BG55_01845 [Erwinia mallotivora]
MFYRRLVAVNFKLLRSFVQRQIKNESQDPESDRGFFYSVKITFQFFGCERLLTCIAIIF